MTDSGDVTGAFDGECYFEEDPQKIGYMFFRALLHKDVEELEVLVTPESRPAWGGFDVAVGLFHSLENPGMVREASRSKRDPNVCYMRIARGVQRSHDITAYTPLDNPLIVTLVWRPEYGRWMVHHLGDPAEPSSIPRGL